MRLKNSSQSKVICKNTRLSLKSEYKYQIKPQKLVTLIVVAAMIKKMGLFTTYIYVTYEMAIKSKEVETKDSEKRSSLKIKISVFSSGKRK